MLNELKESVIYKYEIKNSKFISYIYKINSISEIEKIFELLKKEHKKARHVCYGYKVFDNENLKIKTFDDGEPRGTASIPILNAIEKNKLSNIAIFIVRYFGGIKLGKGGLYRAYTKAAMDSIKEFTQFQN